MSDIRHYRVLPWATGPLTLLESIAKVSNRQSRQNVQIYLLTSLHHDSTITAKTITTVQTRKNSTNHWVLHSPLIVLNERTPTSRRFSGNPTLMLAALRHFVLIVAITSTESTEYVFTYSLYSVHMKDEDGNC